MAIITLTSDHGTKDFYVSAIKGLILSELPAATIVDISHEVNTFDITQAAFIVRNSYFEFPPDTIHIIGVLPDLTDESTHVVVKYDGHYFIAADNGIFALLLDKEPEFILELKKPENRMIKPVKDVFAKAACFIAKGGNLADLGIPKNTLLEKFAYRPVVDRNTIKGSVVYVDHYGNVITNITKSLFEEVGNGKPFVITFRGSGYDMNKICNAYNDVQPSDRMAIFGPTQFLEIAINMGNASQLLGLNLRDTVRIEFEEERNDN